MMMATNGNLPALDGIDDDVLKAYLISRGYANAANALEADVSKLSGSAAEPSLPQKSPSNDGSNAILLEFKEFSSWISNSLDIVKPYLLSLSFAVLVHW